MSETIPEPESFLRCPHCGHIPGIAQPKASEGVKRCGKCKETYKFKKIIIYECKKYNMVGK
jgi:hypothetical protein